MSTAHRILTDMGKAYQPGGNSTIAPPSSGGTFAQKGLAYGVATVGAGTFKLPDNGLPMFIRATGSATITTQLAVTVASIESGDMILAFPLTSTTWAATYLDTGVGPSQELPITKYTTSATTTAVTPGAGALTGAQHVFWENTADGALEVTTRTGPQLYGDITGAYSGMTFLLTIVNRGNNTVTFTGGEDVTVNGETTIATLVTRTYIVTLVNTTAVTFRSINKGTIET